VADGLRHALVDGLAGDDLTALVAGVAGVLLLCDGAQRLWRSRRRDGHWALRRAGLTVAALAAVYFFVLPIALAIVATHPARSPVAAADLGRPYERVQVRTGDGLTLAAWYVPSRNRAAIIAFPGRRGPVPHARMLARAGYGVLLLDRRGEGESEGTANLFGWGGERDLRAALDFLATRPDVERIGGLGLSVGGELMLQTAAHDQRLRAVVSEGAGVRSLAEHLHTPDLGSAQRWATNWLVQTAAVAILSDTAPPADLTDEVRRIGSRPVLLIRGRDGHEDESLNEVYARRIGRSAELWTAPGGHTAAITAAPAAYEQRVLGFFGRTLLAP
jgi:dienelactone hydrolase